MLPVISARIRFMEFSVWFGWSSIVRTRGTVPMGKRSMGFLVTVLGMVVAVIADQADVNADQKRENQRLDKPDQELEKIKGNGKTPPGDARHRMQEILAAENVAEQT